MCRVQSPRLTTVKALSQIVRIPEVEVPDLRALEADNTEEVSRRHLECLGYLRQHYELGNVGQLSAWSVVKNVASNDGNCSTEYASTGGALRRTAASGGGVMCPGFIMLSFPQKVGSDAAGIPRHSSARWLFEA